MESGSQSSSSDVRVRDFHGYCADGGIDFYTLLGDEDYGYWAIEMASDDDFSRFFRWKHARVGKMGHRRWDEKAIRLLSKLAGKYGTRIEGLMFTPSGHGRKMQIRCRRAQKNYEKNAYYWKDA